MREYQTLSNKFLSGKDLEEAYKKKNKETIYETIPKEKYDEKSEWKIEREYKRSIRVSRSKKVLEKLRDDIWCLFKEFGVSRISKVPFDLQIKNSIDDKKTYKIDMVAIEEEVIFVVICRFLDILGEYEKLENDISDFCGNRTEIAKVLRKEIGGNRKTILILATENIQWDDSLRSFAEGNKIIVFDEYDLMKLRDLTKIAGEASKYQVYNRILQGSKIKSVSQKIPALKSKIGGKVCYIFSISPDELLKIAYVHQRATDCSFLELSDSYQRMLKISRVRKIREYIEGGGYFPGSIVLNFQKKITESGLLGRKYERGRSQKQAIPLMIELPPYYGCAWIIDGQHRLYGYADTTKKKKETLSVVAFVKLSTSEQAKIFLDINQYQRSISSDLKWDLYEDLYYQPSGDKERKLYTISKVGKELNKAGPLKKKIKIPKDELSNPSAHIGLESICKCIQRNNFLNKKGDPLYHDDINASIKQCAESLNDFLGLVARLLPEQWKQQDKHFLCTTGGVTILISIFRDIIESLWKYLDNRKEFTEKIRPFVVALVEYIKGLDDNKIKDLREASVGRAQSSQAQAELTREIRKREPYYSHFLSEYEKRKGESDFAKYAKMEEGDTFEAKGSLSLVIDRYLKGDHIKDFKTDLALKGVLKSIVSFLNAEGVEGPSQIAIGLLEKSKYPGTPLEPFGERYLLFGINEEYDEETWDSYERKLHDLIASHISRASFDFIKISKCEYNDKSFCIIRIPKGDRKPDKWYYLDGKFYVRVGGQTKELSGQEADEYKHGYPHRS